MSEGIENSPQYTQVEDNIKSIEDRFITRAEKKYPSFSPASKGLQQEYLDNRDLIADLYENVSYWHGTGRKQYKDGRVIDILDSFIANGGFIPSRDRFDIKGGEVITTSVTDRRMYASLYAKMHQTNQEVLEYEYYPRRFWSNIFLGVTAMLAGKELFPETSVVGKFTMVVRFAQDWKAWFKKVNSKPSLRQRLFNTKSDIPGNYPILFGIKAGVINLAETPKYISVYEKRTNQSIPLSGITHIEVPTAQIAKTKQFLEDRGVGNLPVIPLECGEIYSSQFPPRQHIRGNPFVKV